MSKRLSTSNNKKKLESLPIPKRSQKVKKNNKKQKLVALKQKA